MHITSCLENYFLRGIKFQVHNITYSFFKDNHPESSQALNSFTQSKEFLIRNAYEINFFQICIIYILYKFFLEYEQCVQVAKSRTFILQQLSTNSTFKYIHRSKIISSKILETPPSTRISRTHIIQPWSRNSSLDHRVARQDLNTAPICIHFLTACC